MKDAEKRKIDSESLNALRIECRELFRCCRDWIDNSLPFARKLAFETAKRIEEINQLRLLNRVTLPVNGSLLTVKLLQIAEFLVRGQEILAIEVYREVEARK